MKDKIVLYSTPTCGMCKLIKKKLNEAHVEFEINQDETYMIANKILHIPILEVNGHRMNAQEAINWINERDRKFEN